MTTVADVDGVTLASGAIRVWSNAGGGSFVARQTLPANALCSGAALGDVDGDGDLDLATAEGFDSGPLAVQSRLLLNDGSARFTDVSATHLPAWLGGEHGVRFADADADGDLDLLYVSDTVTAGRPRLRYLRNQGAGVFVADPTAIDTTGIDRAHAAAFAQLDGDPELELVLSYTGGPNHLEYVGLFDRVGGTWQDVAPIRLPNLLGFGSTGFTLIDFDEDGDLDLLLQRQPIAALANDGSGSFTDVTAARGEGLRFASVPGVLAPDPGIAVDVDGDGDLDVIASCVQINQQRHLRAPLPPRTGRPWLLEFTAEPGYGTGSHLALVGLGLSRQPVAIVTPFGSFALGQPSALVAAITSNSGVAGTASLAVPPTPALSGLPLWLQGIELALPAGSFHFTNLVRTVVE